MSSNNKLNPASASFLPSPSGHFDPIPEYMKIFGTDFSAGFPEQDYFLPEQPTDERQHDPSTLDTPKVTLEMVQRNMSIAFNSFMQLQNEYHDKLQHVER